MLPLDVHTEFHTSNLPLLLLVKWGQLISVSSKSKTNKDYYEEACCNTLVYSHCGLFFLQLQVNLQATINQA